MFRIEQKRTTKGEDNARSRKPEHVYVMPLGLGEVGEGVFGTRHRGGGGLITDTRKRRRNLQSGRENTPLTGYGRSAERWRRKQTMHGWGVLKNFTAEEDCSRVTNRTRR